MLPPPHTLARGDFEMVVRRLADDLAFGADNSLFVGGGLEYASSRPYQPGDSVRALNWRLTARTGRPFVKEYEALKRTCVYLVVDTSASMAVASTALSKHDVAVWVAAAVGLLAQRRLSPVAILGAGERTTPLYPSLLSNDLWHALDPLRAHAFAEGTHLSRRLSDLGDRAARRSVFLIVSDLHDPGALGAVRHAAQKHECAVLHTIDPAEGGRLGAGFFRGREAETGATFLAHSRAAWDRSASLQDELARSCVDYLPLRTGESFIAPLRHFLSTRGRASRGSR